MIDFRQIAFALPKGFEGDESAVGKRSRGARFCSRLSFCSLSPIGAQDHLVNLITDDCVDPDIGRTARNQEKKENVTNILSHTRKGHGIYDNKAQVH